MRVLHYISDFTVASGPIVQAVRRMLVAVSEVAECHLVTSTPVAADYVKVLEEECGIRVHFLRFGRGVNPLSQLSATLDVRSLLKEVQPDVVHVHGAWDWRAALVERTSRGKRIVTLVSPHRGLSPELLNIDFWNHKLPRLLAYQVWMIRNCSAVIAVNDREAGDIKSLNIKRRIEVMPQPAGAADDSQKLGRALMAAYQKALDTVYGNSLTEEEKALVQAAVTAAVVPVDEQRLEKPSLEGVSFRRVFFYAYDEDVMQQFINGCKNLNIALPTVPDVPGIPRYKNRRAKQRGALKDNPVAINNSRLPGDCVPERLAIAMICKAKALSLPRLTLRHYAELYDMFRHSDFDEDKVQAELKRMNMRRFTKRLQKLLARMYGLQSGYDIF